MAFTFQFLHPIYDILNDEVDVIVKLHSSQQEYHVTFVTYLRAQEIFQENPLSIFSNTLFIDQLTEEDIAKALSYVIDERFYLSIFYPINEQARIALFRKLEQENKI